MYPLPPIIYDKNKKTTQTLRIVGCCVVIAISILSSYVINTRPYSYQTKFWLFFLAGLLTYIILLMIDDALKIKIVETTQYGFLLLAIIFNVVIVTSAYSPNMSVTPTGDFVNASVFLIGLASLHSLYVIVTTLRQFDQQHTQRATPGVTSAIHSAAAPQQCTLPPAPSVGSTPKVIDNDEYDQLYEQVYSEGYLDAMAERNRQRTPATSA